MINTPLFKLAVGFSIIFAASACAVGDRETSLYYPPKSNEPIEFTAAAGQSEDIYLTPFKDLRPFKQIIGDLASNVSWTSVEVRTQSDIGKWLASGLEQELMRAGYKAVRLEEQDVPSDALVVSGFLLKVYCHVFVTPRAEVHLEAKLSRNGNVLLKEEYTGYGNIGTEATLEDSCAESLAVALRQAGQNLASAIRERSL